MAISKKLRFEVFKRDGFRCAYCGNQPPSVVLEVDHIQPKSKKGKDNIENLITSCFDCNRGKSNIELSKITPQMADNLEILKQKEEQLKEYRKFVAKIRKREDKDIEYLEKVYSMFFPHKELPASYKIDSLRVFLRRLPLEQVEGAMVSAGTRIPNSETRALKYFCGICWNKIKRASGAEGTGA